ncbi:MAG: flavin-containing monooxygenase, partial [Halioglobus sp.]
MKTYYCVIIGCGFSGICMAIKLQEAGLGNFLVLEKADQVGGTWRDNRYPGAECDVPSALYSYSFETKTDWDYQWSEQSQILEYINNVVDKHRLREHIRCNSELTSAHYDSERSMWELQLGDGTVLEAQHVVSAVGQLHKQNTPEIPGQSAFCGTQFHSADWPDDLSLAGKSVAVIGSAASAVQFVPRIAEEAAQLTVYQRSPNWLAPKRDRPYTEREKDRMRRFPIIKSLSRLKVYLRNELIPYTAIKGNRLTSWMLRKVCLSYLHDTVKDEALRHKLTPDYPIGAKRILTANGYYEALVRDNTELVTDAVERLDDTGIVSTDGQHRRFDVIIYGTGFITNPFLDGIEVTGRSGRTLAEHWNPGAHAYLGVATSDFPNLFFLYGPNTNLGHNSILLMSEAQVAYIIRAMTQAQATGKQSIEVREGVEARYNERLQRRLGEMAWSRISDSWYMSAGMV